MIFDDRRDAAEKLAAQLEQYRGMHAAVLAIPRGAIEMGSAIARHLDAELDVALVRKLRCPWDEEFAIGAVDESGWSYIAPHAEPLAISAQYIESERQEQLAVLKARRARYTPGRGPLDLAGRIAIVVDDGLATGSTMRAALHAVRARNPAKLVCAVPVASVEGIECVRPYADEVVCLSMPAHFGAVARFYRSFPQVTDETAIRLLRESEHHA